MDNRFGFKELIICSLLIVVIVMIYLSMEQFDRQWTVVQQTNQQLQQQAGDISRIRQLLEQGAVSINSGGNATSRPAPMAGFERILASQAEPGYAQGDDLVDTFTVVPDKLTPLISTDAYSANVQSYVLDSLVDRDPSTLQWIPRLAESWSYINPLTIEFKLRRGVTFSDGAPLTADDVVFTMNWTMNPDVEAPATRSYLDKFDKVVKVDDYTVRFVFKSPYFKEFDIAGGTQVLSKKFYSQFTPQQFNESTGYLIGSGPYRLPDPTSWTPEPGKPVILLRNERYWGPTPSFNRLVWKVIENPSARVTTFRNGDSDIFGPAPDVYDDMLKDAALVARTQHYALDVPNSGYEYIGWNEKHNGAATPFADPRVRRAMTMLTDRESICSNILKGYATVNTGPFSALTPQADPTIQPWPYDPDAAQKLLADAGYVRQGDHVVGPDGKPLQFELMYNTNSEPGKRMAAFVKDTYAKAGVLVTPKPTEWSVLLQRVTDRDFEAVLLGWSGDIENDPYQIFDSSQMAGTGDDFVQYDNPECDKAIEAARSEVDENVRMPLWHKVHQILHQDQPYTFLFISKDLEFLSGRIHGVEVTKLGLNSNLEWYVPAALQKYHD